MERLDELPLALTEIIEVTSNSGTSSHKLQQQNELHPRLQQLLEITESYYQKIINSTQMDSSSNEDEENNDINIRNPAKRLKLESDDLKEKEMIKFDKTPSYIKNGKMRDYQLRGLNWLICLEVNGLDGLLADEMGLGKTLQTISFLGYLKHHRKNKRPHLIIAPKSTMQNWINEISKWCPSLHAVCLIGDKVVRRQFFEKLEKFDILVTTYELLIVDSGKLVKFDWKYLVVDEAQRIKNINSKLSKLVRRFDVKHRLLLTGTPFQNNLPELWALLNFLMPDMFNSKDDFNTWFDSEKCLNNTILAKHLHNVLRPFVLRRLKSDVEKSLKPKKEYKIFIGLTRMQRELYEKILLDDFNKVDIFGDVRKRSVRNLIMPLRKCVDHPYLFEGIEPGPPYITDETLVLNSNKMIVLDKLLVKLKKEKSKVLIFCVFKGMLDILEDYCGWREYQYCRMDGETRHKSRIEIIESFNAKNSNKFIFMSTTRCGGLGINLQAANSVIIYSSDWNPHVDLQAMDRAHRIGQKKDVNVYRFITEHTIEERVEQLSRTKMHLDKMISLRDVISFERKNLVSIRNIEECNEDISDILAESEKKALEKKSEADEINEYLSFDYFGSLYIFEGEDYRIKKQQKADKDDDRPRRWKNYKSVCP